MTVGRLIEELKKCSPDSIVMVFDGTNYFPTDELWLSEERNDSVLLPIYNHEAISTIEFRRDDSKDIVGGEKNNEKEF